MDGGAWWAAVHGVTKSQTRLSNFTFTVLFHALEKGNGNPLQCSGLENPRDAGAWWAAVYGVAQSWPRLKRLSSSSSSSPGHALVLSATPPLNYCYKVKKVKALATQLCPTLCDPRGL